MSEPKHVREALAAARVARTELGLGLEQPVHDLLEVVEQAARVPVAVLDLPHQVAGAYLVRRDRPFIFVNGNDWVPRQRLTLAHELGHHRMHGHAVVDGEESVDGRSDDPLEEQAYAFAGEFVAPEQALRGWLAARGDPVIDLEIVVRLGLAFGISAPAMMVRLVSAGIILRQRQREQIWNQINLRQHREAERALTASSVSPVEDQLAQIKRDDSLPRMPAELRENALEAYEAGLINLDRLAAALGRGRGAAESLVTDLGISQREPEPDW